MLRFTDNQDAYIDTFGDWPAGKSLQELQLLAAYEAMSTDVQDGLDPEDFEDD